MLPADDLLLLTARARAADGKLIVSSVASASLDGAIKTPGTKGPLAPILLIDASSIRTPTQQLLWRTLVHAPARRFDTLNEAMETARRYFGDGSRQQLKVVLPMRSEPLSSESARTRSV